MTKVAKTTLSLPPKPKPQKETHFTFYDSPEEISIPTKGKKSTPKGTGTVLSFLIDINQIKPESTPTEKYYQPTSIRSPLLEHNYTPSYPTEEVIKPELTGDNIDTHYFCCIPCPIL